jgi:polar amino acid transport system substrate-binding protein
MSWHTPCLKLQRQVLTVLKFLDHATEEALPLMTSRFWMSRKAVAGAALLLSCLVAQAAAADTLDDIKKRGHMVVAIDPTFSPYEFTTADGAITGYDPELLQLIAKDVGLTVEFQKMAFDGVIPGLIAGSFDFTSTALNVTAERAKRIAYTIPVSKTQNVVLTTSAPRVTSAEPLALAGHTVAVKQGTQPESLMKQISKDLVAAGKPAIDILSLQTVQQTVDALGANRADFVVDDIAVLTEAAEKSGGADKIVGNIGEPIYIAWGVRKTDEKLQQMLDDELKKLQKSGQMKALQEKYFHTSYTLPTSDFLPK